MKGKKKREGLNKMKKLILVLAMVFIATSAFAIDNYTLLSAKTTTGTGSTLPLQVYMDEFTCVVTWGGTTPTNTVVELQGSLDGTTFATLATVTVTATGQMFHVVDKMVQYVRGKYVSRSDGDATTAVTLKVSAR